MGIRKERLILADAGKLPGDEPLTRWTGDLAANPASLPESPPGKVVIYWMQSAVRAFWNVALNHAADEARRLGLPLVTLFILDPANTGYNPRHGWFMIQGLKECKTDLAGLGLAIQVLVGPGSELLCRVGREWGAALVITDQAPSILHRKQIQELAGKLSCPLVEACGETVVPVHAAYPRQAWSAAVLRPRLKSLIPGYLDDIQRIPDTRNLPEWTGSGTGLPMVDLQSLACPQDLSGLLPGLPSTPGPVASAMGGRSHGLTRLRNFLESGLESYGTRHSDPGAQAVSGLSPWLHGGQLGVAEILHAVLEHGVECMEENNPAMGQDEIRRIILRRLFEKAVPEEGIQACLEELLVRRDLAFNYCHYNPGYRSFSALPDWARSTLLAHAGDPRPVIHSLAELEEAATHDPVWNACQKQLRDSGTIHGYLRMYWGKKILEWSAHPEEAFDRAMYLNDKWALDGRDPNGWAGVAWCFGLHDRPWAQRPVFGTVRYMNLSGLRRKFDLTPYLNRWG